MQSFKSCLAAIIAVAISTPSHAATFTTLRSFTGGKAGTNPDSNLLNHGGMLYGVTLSGGAGQGGVAFRMSRTTGAVKVLYSFQGADLGPSGGLTPYDGSLYGTTMNGGTYDTGTIYRLDPRTRSQSVVYNFSGNTGNPFTTLVFDNAGNAYGTATGGANGAGVVFKFTPSTGAETTLYNFTGNQGDAFPQADLILHGNTLYGTTQGDSIYFYGTVFSLNIITGTETVLHSFTNTPDGAYPSGPLVEKSGILYGTTMNGGAPHSVGTIYAIDLATGTEQVVFNFVDANGNGPQGLTEHNGLFYGTTGGGGISENGTIYQIDPATWTQTSLYDFTGGTDGAWPLPGLDFRQGTAYGATGYGTGTIFSITP